MAGESFHYVQLSSDFNEKFQLKMCVPMINVQKSIKLASLFTAHLKHVHFLSIFPVSLCLSAGLLRWRAVQLSLTSPSSGSRPSGTPLWGRSRPFTPRTPTSTHTWTTSVHFTAAPPSPFCQPPGASALQMVNKVKHTPTHTKLNAYTHSGRRCTLSTHMHICT